MILTRSFLGGRLNTQNVLHRSLVRRESVYPGRSSPLLSCPLLFFFAVYAVKRVTKTLHPPRLDEYPPPTPLAVRASSEERVFARFLLRDGVVPVPWCWQVQKQHMGG